LEKDYVLTMWGVKGQSYTKPNENRAGQGDKAVMYLILVLVEQVGSHEYPQWVHRFSQRDLKKEMRWNEIRGKKRCYDFRRNESRGPR